MKTRLQFSESQLEAEARRTRKRQRIVRSNAIPVLQSVCKWVWLLSILVPVLFFFMEILSFISREAFSLASFVRAGSFSSLSSWLIIGIPSVILSAVQFFRLKYTGYNEYTFIFQEELPKGDRLSQYTRVEIPDAVKKDERLVLYSKPVKKIAQKKYLRFMISTGTVGAVLLVCYFIILNFTL